VAGVPCRKAFGDLRLVDGCEPAVMAGVSDLEAAELRCLARGAAVLEVGSAWGYSAIVMAKVARSLVSIDPHQDYGSLATFQANVRAHGVRDKVTVLVTTSRLAMPELLARGSRFDLIFIDGDHSAEAVAFDALWARHLVTPGGVIAFHDYNTGVSAEVVKGLEGWRPFDRLVDSLAVYEGPWV
jgi:predicted O-methyltransferase YrrM